VLASNEGADPLANAVVPTGGSEAALKTPSGQQSGLKLKANIEVAANQLADVVLDFDACKSVVTAGNSGQRLLKPVVSVIPRYVSGVQGYVEAALAGGTTMISLQQDGDVVKATVPGVTGQFLLQPVAPGTYDLVVTAPGRVTSVVTGVVVTQDTVTPLNASAAALAPSTSASASAVGSVTPAEDGSVRATQALSSGKTIEVAGGPVSGDGSYAMTLPVAAPMVAAWTSGAALTFSADTTAAGKYTLEARSGDSTKTAGPLTFAAGSTVTTNFTFP